MNKAFVLGAGLGNRLKPLTEQLPKPLIPVFGRPLISFAFEHLSRIGVDDFIVNTHHLADEYERHFPDGTYGKAPITFRNEPVLLETGGGIDNVCDLLGGAPFYVYNGDILTDLPLAPLRKAHSNSGHLVTLALRSKGPALHLELDDKGAVTDIRNMLGTGGEGTHQFTGIYACDPAFLSMLRHGEKHSVIPIFLDLIKTGRLGGAVIDEGHWWDLGTRDAYLDAHAAIAGSDFPGYLGGEKADWQKNAGAGAEIAADANIDAASCVADGAKVGAGAVLENSIVWSGGEVAPGAHLKRCIVRSGQTASGSIEGLDL